MQVYTIFPKMSLLCIRQTLIYFDSIGRNVAERESNQIMIFLNSRN